MPASRKHRQAHEIESVLRHRISVPANADIRLPSETELSEEFGVSRVTVREALASLERKGLILRRQGLGTFVNTQGVDIQTRLDESIEFAELIRSSGYEPDLSYLECEQTFASTDVAARLKIDVDAAVLTITKVFTASRTPVVYCTNMIPLNLVADSLQSSLVETIRPDLSVYTVLAHWFSQYVAFQISDVEACNADEAQARMLNCAPGTALLRLVEVGFNDRQQAVFLGDVYYMPGLIQFQLIRKPVFKIEPIPQG
jgi:GntR family transcriptional regulator